MSRFCVEIFSSRNTEKLSRGTLLCFTKILVSKKFMEKRGGGGEGASIKIFRRNFLVTSVGNFRRGIL